ncbi:MAG: hypothetical protein ACI86M_002315 [Saprospiraceae bacterium]|jgi:hypothetical protein
MKHILVFAISIFAICLSAQNTFLNVYDDVDDEGNSQHTVDVFRLKNRMMVISLV